MLTFMIPSATLVRLGMLAEPTKASASTLMLSYSTVTSGKTIPVASHPFAGYPNHLLIRCNGQRTGCLNSLCRIN